MTDWAAKVLEGVVRYRPKPPGVMVPDQTGVWVDHRHVTAAIAKLGAGDGLVERLNRADEYEPLGHDGWEAAARIAALTAQNQTWQRNSRETFDAMVAMRNSINEHLPMPSLESDLLQGPENSVFCAAVADAVVQHVAALTAQNREMALDVLASSGQAQEAYAAQIAAEAERDALRAKVARLEAAVIAAAKIGQIVGFLGEDEGRIEAFREACGPELWAKARAALADGVKDGK